MVASRRAIATVACQNEYVFLVARLNGVHYRYGVDNATVEHRYSVYIYYLADVWQRAWRMGYVSQTLAVVMLLKIFGASRQTVGSDHLVCGVVAEEGVVVVGDILVREFVVQQFCV